MKFFDRTRLDDKDAEKLIISLKKLAKPFLEETEKQAMKAGIFDKIAAECGPAHFSFIDLIANIKKIAAKVFLPVQSAALMKERVLNSAERNAGSPVSTFYGRSFRAAMSLFLLIIFTATTFLGGMYRVPVALASGTFLDEVEGDVLVMRDGHTIPGQKDLSLNSGDVVVTLDKSSVTIHFLDDSIGRLSENSGLKMQVLYSSPDNPLITDVQLVLMEGRLWGRVINLIDERAGFSVVTPEVQTHVVKKASFDIYTKDNVTKLAVFDNAVDLMSADSSKDIPVKTVIAGYKAEVNGAVDENLQVKLISDDDPEIQASKAWVAKNMVEDGKYGQSVAYEVTADVLNAGIENEPRVPVFADADLEKLKQDFLKYYNDLIVAETMLVRQNHKMGISYLRSFTGGMQNIESALTVFDVTDPANADLFRQMVSGKINIQMKDMAAFLPGEALYPVKEVLEGASVLMVRDDAGKTLNMVSNYGVYLLEMQELIKQGKIYYARTVFSNYRSKIDNLVLNIGGEDKSALKDKFIELAKQQIQQIKLLTAIAESLGQEDFADLLAEIKTVRNQIMLKLLGALTQMGSETPSDLVVEIRDIYKTYGRGEADIDTMMEIFDKLNTREGGLNFIPPDQAGIPTEMGAILIIDQEATPDVKMLELGDSQQAKN
jgi:hypothetical protein